MKLKQCWNQNRENKQIVSSLLYQKPSNIMLYIFLKLGVSATDVSFLMLLTSIVGVILMFIPTKLTIILGVLCFVFAIILDHTDGDIARITKKGSMLGTLYDVIHHSLEEMFMFMALGFYTFYLIKTLWPTLYGLDYFLNPIYLGVGISILFLVINQFKFYMLANLNIKPRDDLQFRKFPWVLFYGNWFKIWYWLIILCVMLDIPYILLESVFLWSLIRIPVIIYMYYKACKKYDLKNSFKKKNNF